MKSVAIPLAGAALAALLAVGVTSAANPTTPVPAATPAPVVTPAGNTATGTVAAILGLTNAQVMELRHAGKSLAQIAEQQKVDPQKLIDAMAAQWTAQIDARLAAGAITADQAATLKANVATQAKAMVYQVTMGGMMGGAVGAGPNGTMHGQAGMGAGMGAQGGMRGRGGMMNGAAGRGMMNGTGTCPVATPAPAS